jgi:hypothetical protein
VVCSYLPPMSKDNRATVARELWTRSKVPHLWSAIRQGAALDPQRGRSPCQRAMTGECSAGLLQQLRVERSHEGCSVPKGRVLPVPLSRVQCGGREQGGRGVSNIKTQVYTSEASFAVQAAPQPGHKALRCILPIPVITQIAFSSLLYGQYLEHFLGGVAAPR